MSFQLSDALRGRDFITLHDFTGDEIRLLLDTAATLKKMHKNGEVFQPLAGKTLGMIFHKASTRTRVSFQVGMFHLGGQASFFGANELQLGRGEPVPDTARVLSRYLDAILIRTFSHELVLTLAEHADVPVINGLTDLLHPTQIIADMLTIIEHRGQLAGKKLAFVGDGNNMAHSLMLGGVKVGMEVAIACPPGYTPDSKIMEWVKEDAAASGGKAYVTHDVRQAMEGADVLYTDVWASMGQEAEQKEREKAFVGYQINEENVQYAKPDYLFLHCLPAHRGEEVTAAIIDGEHSAVFDEAENRLHAHKAIMALTM